MALLLLIAAQVAGLFLIVFGLPGLWVQVVALALFAWFGDFQTAGPVILALVTVLALLAEIAEFLLGGRYARRHGGGARAGIGAVAGGLAGALIGLPIPLLGSIFGAMLGSFLGAFLLELTTGRGAEPALRAGWGAFIGRIVATAMKAAVGVIILVLSVIAAIG
jgi:uncharacterized protein